MEYIHIDDSSRELANSFIKQRWSSTEMVIRGKAFELSEMGGIMAIEGGKVVGLVTYFIKDLICEIASLDSVLEGRGIGTELVNSVVSLARENNCKKVILETTNDNINALRFYQKRGFDMVALRFNSLDEARKIKPGIPMTGKHGIPLRHNVEFEMLL